MFANVFAHLPYLGKACNLFSTIIIYHALIELF